MRKGANEVRVAVWSAKTLRRWSVCVICAAAAGVLLAFPQAAQTGVRRGLAVCAEMLIPSLFPFLVLSGFIIRSGMAGGIGQCLSPLMRRVFGLSGSAAAAMIISLIGGYPAGADAVASLYEQGDIGKDEGQRLLRCCVSAGPAFIIGGIGVGMLGSAAAGVRLLAAHWLAFAVVALTERQKTAPASVRAVRSESVGAAVAQSVHAAAQSLLSMCGFVLLASGMLSIGDAAFGEWLPPLWRCVIGCTAEISTGCVEAAQMGMAAPFWLGAALGFGGLSVHGQIASRTAALSWMDRGFFRARLLHALLGGTLSMVLLRGRMPVGETANAALSVFTQENPLAAASGLTATMLLCVIFLYTLPVRSRGKE